MSKRDHDFDDWVDLVLARNPAGLSDVWIEAAKHGWDARKEFETSQRVAAPSTGDAPKEKL